MRFDSMNVESVNVEINSFPFPDKEIKNKFTSREITEIYDRFLQCSNRF